MPADDDYYIGDSPFDGYEVTSINPGWVLLALTMSYTILCMLLGMILRCRKKEQLKIHGTNDFMKKIHKRYDDSAARDKPHQKGMELLDLDHSKVDLASVSSSADLEHIEKVLFTNVYPKRGGGGSVIPSRKKKRLLPKRSSFFHRTSSNLLASPTNSTLSEIPEVQPKERNSMYILELKPGKSEDSSTRQLGDHTGTNSHHHEASTSNVSAANSKQTTKTGENVADGYSKMEDIPEDREPNKQNREEDLSLEIRNMFNLARPWAYGSFVVNAASLITISVISHYMGVAEMICYSYVWFILDASHIISDAMFSSLYKHANNCVAMETDEGNEKAGKYIRVCIFCNAVISIPICLGLVFAMAPIMSLFGYGPKVIALTNQYTIVAAISKVISSSDMYITIIPDLDGHADFDAIYGFVDSLLDIILAMTIIPYLQPSLLQLGLIHLAQDLVSMVAYYSITWGWNGWYDKYKGGMFSKLDLHGKDKALVKSLMKKTVPLFFDAVTGELEWFVLTFFAAYLGAAESATWILISHIEVFVGILPECIASASEYRVAHLLSNGNIYLAQKLSSAALWMTFLSTSCCCFILWLFKGEIVGAVTQDETLDGMLIEIITYIVLIDPILSIATATSYLNQGLAMYKRTTKVDFLLTVLVTIPCALISTFVFGYDIEGLTAAIYIGYATIGFFSITIFANADWERAAEKNKALTCTEDEDGDDDEDDIDYGQLQIGQLLNRAELV